MSDRKMNQKSEGQIEEKEILIKAAQEIGPIFCTTLGMIIFKNNKQYKNWRFKILIIIKKLWVVLDI